MSTPHNQASMGDIAKVVLMPGDPLRAKYAAETFLEDVVQFNSVRNMFGYTGTYKGKKVSIMGSGMGMPSIGIYSYELFNEYGVDTIIRIGSAGGYTEDLKLYDVMLVTSAFSESNYAKIFDGSEEHIEYSDPKLNADIMVAAEELGIDLKEGRTHSSDVFYHMNEDYRKEVDAKGCKCVEMESYSLFANARALNKKASALLTISDSFVYPEVTSHEERRTKFIDMMKVALEAAIRQ